MITLNNREYPWREGLTVRQLLDETNYVYRRITVKVNGKFLSEAEWTSATISDGNVVEALHLMAGG